MIDVMRSEGNHGIDMRGNAWRGWRTLTWDASARAHRPVWYRPVWYRWSWEKVTEVETTLSAPETRRAQVEKSKLRKTLRLVDMFFFSVCAMLTLETLGSVASYGAQALTLIVVCGITFYLPYALLTAELGAALPVEGGIVEWVRRGTGAYPAALTAFFYWISNPVWLGGIVTSICIGVMQEFVTPLASRGSQLVFGLAFIWLCVAATVVGLRQGKWLPVTAAWAKVVLLVAFVGSALAYIGKHGGQGLHVAALAPTGTIVCAGVAGADVQLPGV